MTDKELIKCLQAVIEAQQEEIKVYQAMYNTQSIPPYTISSGPGLIPNQGKKL